MSSFRNILVITFDQWRADARSGVAGGWVDTPHVARLAQRGVDFRNHVSVTIPCGPSRASLLTGLYATTHRSVGNGTPLSSRFDTLPAAVRRVGMRPVLFGYTDTTPDPTDRPATDPALTSYEGVMDGFDIGQVLLEDGGDWLAHLRDNGIDVPGPGYAIYQPTEPPAPGRRVSDAPCRVPAHLSETAFLADRAIAFLEAPGPTPFLAHISFLRPHPPFTAPAAFHDQVDPAAVPLPRPAPVVRHPFHQFLLDRTQLAAFVTGAEGLAHDLGERDVRRLRASYAALVREVDHHLGRILETLDATGRAADTLVVLTSDHGEMLGEEGLWGKVGWWRESYHVPLIFAGAGLPDQAIGRVVDAPTESVDVMPTLLTLLGAPTPRQCEGRPLIRLMTGAPPADWRSTQRMSFDFRDPIGRVAEDRFGLPSDACLGLVRRDPTWTYAHLPGQPPLLRRTPEERTLTPNCADDPEARDVRLARAEAMLADALQSGDRSLVNLRVSPHGIIEAPDARRCP